MQFYYKLNKIMINTKNSPIVSTFKKLKEDYSAKVFIHSRKYCNSIYNSIYLWHDNYKKRVVPAWNKLNTEKQL